jgi:hypothetical protein
MAKVTFTVSDDTVRTLKDTAARLGKPQSLVVREAIAEYAARAGQLTEAERRRMLKALDDLAAAQSTKSAADVDRERRDVRRARRAGGRKHPA